MNLRDTIMLELLRAAGRHESFWEVTKPENQLVFARGLWRFVDKIMEERELGCGEE